MLKSFFFLSFGEVLLSFFIIVIQVFERICNRQLSFIRPFRQVFRFIIQRICSLWWIKSSPQRPSRDKSTQKLPANWQGCKHLSQKGDSNKVAPGHFYWNYSSAWVPPPAADWPHMTQNIPKMALLPMHLQHTLR